MTDQYLTFQSFTDAGLAKGVADKLKEYNIPFEFEDTSSPIDPVIIGSPLAADLRLKLRQQDFARATAIMEEYYSTQLDLVDKDYYMFSFSDAELFEVTEKPDEWGSFDYKLAQKILKDRGNEISAERLETIKASRIREIAKPEEIGNFWILIGYFMSIFFSPLGIFYGSSMLTVKKTLPYGQRVYTYNENNRKHARKILIISSVLTTLWLILKMLSVRQD